jgi:hypothetical protein
MPTLRELQAGFREALLGGAERVAAAAIRGDGLTPTARLAVYRHHVVTSLTAALESTYPVVARLVDPRFFRYAADRYIRERPPANPRLSEYGADFGDFLGAFEPSRHLEYLPDVARLECALNVAMQAPDMLPIAPETLREPVMLALHPSVTLLRSPWPLDAIWRANQPGAAEDTVDLACGGVLLQVWRWGDDAAFRRLTAGGFAFRDALRRGGQLADAAQAALAADASLDLAALIREVLDEEVLVPV